MQKHTEDGVKPKVMSSSKKSTKDATGVEESERNLPMEKLLVTLFWCCIGFHVYLNWNQPIELVYHAIGTSVAGICIFLYRDVSARFGQFLSVRLHQLGFVNEPPLRSRIQQRKWIEQSWQLAVHVLFSGMGIIILFNGEHNFLLNTKYLWAPEKPWHQTQYWLMYPYIYIQWGIWVCTSLLHIFHDERRKDFVTMLAHHVTTVFLVSTSTAHGYHRYGMLVLLIHDISDIPIDLLKLFNYLQLSGRQGWYATETIFIINLISWICLRLGAFPFIMIWTATFEGPYYVTDGFYELNKIPWRLREINDSIYFPSYICLWVLQALHVWWFFLLLRILKKMCCVSPRVASREEYEGASDDEDDETDDNREDAKGSKGKKEM